MNTLQMLKHVIVEDDKDLPGATYFFHNISGYFPLHWRTLTEVRVRGEIGLKSIYIEHWSDNGAQRVLSEDSDVVLRQQGYR